MKKLYCFIFTLIALVCVSCNNDVFIDKMSLTTDSDIIRWDGGKSTITINGQPIDGATLSLWRKVDGNIFVMEDVPIDCHISMSSPNVTLKNSLFAISLSLSETRNNLTLDVAHNYYPDTIFIRVRMQSEYESGETLITVMPSPGFDHGEISYTLDSWEVCDRRYVATAYGVINGSDKPYNHKIFSKGQTVTTRFGWFRPWDIELSENIFGRNTDFTVPTVNYDNIRFDHSPDGQPLQYSTVQQIIDVEPLICNEDKTIEVPPFSTLHVRVWVEAEEHGFMYKFPAINPATGDTIMIEGKYWISVPEKFEIEIE